MSIKIFVRRNGLSGRSVIFADELFVADSFALAYQIPTQYGPGNNYDVLKTNHHQRNIVTDPNLKLWQPRLDVLNATFSDSTHAGYHRTCYVSYNVSIAAEPD